MERMSRTLLTLGLALPTLSMLCSGCNEMRFRQHASFDFERFPRARVALVGVPPEDEELKSAASRLFPEFVERLRAIGGFREVMHGTPMEEEADVTIFVELERVKRSSFVSSSDSCDCERTLSVDMRTRVRALGAGGEVALDTRVEEDAREDECQTASPTFVEVLLGLSPGCRAEDWQPVHDEALEETLDEALGFFLGGFEI